MSTKIFVNLPVSDLQASIDFFTKVGYSFNPQFTDENATCMIISEDIYAMLLTHSHFKQFTSREIIDATKSVETLIALSCDSREEVDALVDRALDAGGTEAGKQDHGFMYNRSYADLDGHVWEILWMDPSAIQ